jgi:hypothetical protein
MINFKLSAVEISELFQQIPNFEVILKALDEHPKIALDTDLITDLDDWIDFSDTKM